MPAPDQSRRTPQQISTAPVCSCQREMTFLGRSTGSKGSVIGVFACPSCDTRVVIGKDSLYLAYLPADCCGQPKKYIGTDSRQANSDGLGAMHIFDCLICGLCMETTANMRVDKPLPKATTATSKMTIPITCSCGANLRAKLEHAGKRLKCPKCGQSVFAPAQSAAPAPAPPKPSAATQGTHAESDNSEQLVVVDPKEFTQWVRDMHREARRELALERISTRSDHFIEAYLLCLDRHFAGLDNSLSGMLSNSELKTLLSELAEHHALDVSLVKPIRRLFRSNFVTENARDEHRLMVERLPEDQRKVLESNRRELEIAFLRWLCTTPSGFPCSRFALLAFHQDRVSDSLGRSHGDGGAPEVEEKRRTLILNSFVAHYNHLASDWVKTRQNLMGGCLVFVAFGGILLTVILIGELLLKENASEVPGLLWMAPLVAIASIVALVKFWPWRDTSRAATQAAHGESDNVGSRQDTLQKADTYWLARQLKPKKEPYLLYSFSTEKEARDALLGAPCIHIANDTMNLICTEPLTFGYYDTGNGRFEAIVAGSGLDTELFTKCRESFRRHGGKPQGEGELAPSAQSTATKKDAPSKKSFWQHLRGIFGSGDTKPQATVEFVRKYTEPNDLGTLCTYEIYRAPNSESAKVFLKTRSVTRQLHYVVVETPEGNWGRDKDGMYQE